jgi:hypothetical protein
MTTLVSVWKDVGTQIDIDADAPEHSIAKLLAVQPDSDGSNKWADDNRYLESWTITGTCSCASKENLVATIKIVMGATYPKLRVYDKSAGPNYNDYSPVQLIKEQDTRLGDDLYRVSLTFQR